MKSIKLAGGPCNNQIVPCGVHGNVRVATGRKPGEKRGYMIYEPNEDRTLAFFLETKWHGTIGDNGQLIPNK